MATDKQIQFANDLLARVMPALDRHEGLLNDLANRDNLPRDTKGRAPLISQVIRNYTDINIITQMDDDMATESVRPTITAVRNWLTAAEPEAVIAYCRNNAPLGQPVMTGQLVAYLGSQIKKGAV